MSTDSSFSQNIGNSNLTIPTLNSRQLILNNSSDFQIVDENSNVLLSLVPGSGVSQQSILGTYVNEGDGNSASVEVSSDTATVNAILEADYNDNSNKARIICSANSTSSYLFFQGAHKNLGLVEYADNAAAILGGLDIGDSYHTAGIVKVVI